ncbi:coiled-coil domain-containing protein 14 [Platichthys flesus]|uniref:coiled-coil domain-containing protein 14 n=1 Tax=Platichthys flesus TaxID=8260 RepID=UPI002DB7111C|nr:coiled-coil domain-containing protein 14 [Platichthys flesus]
MKATAKHKAVTSGRLMGGAKVQPPRRQVNLGTPARPPEPAYSLYSTDPEEQVTTLHQGLDRCAALLSGILQADTTEVSPRLHRAGTCGAAKSRPPTSLGKKPMKKVPKKTVHKIPPSGQRGAGSTTPTPQSPTPAAHSGVKLHPTLRRVHTKAHHSPSPPPPQPQASTPPPHTSVLLSVHQSSSQLPPGQTEGPSSDEQEFVPVRDTDTQHTATHAAAGHTPSNTHSCTTKVSDMRLEPGPVQEVPQDPQSRELYSAGEDVKEQKVQYLLRELKALITGQGSVAERLLHHLEQAVSSPVLNDGGLNIHTESAADLSPLHDQNLQLRRRVRILNQQLMEKEKAERRQDTESNSEVTILQEEVTTAQLQLRELQHDLAELRKDLQDTQSQLRGREAENTAIRTDLEAARSRLVDTERQRSELESLGRQRLEEIGNLKRMLQSQGSSDCSTVVESLPPTPQQLPNERVTQYLMSLGQFDPAPAEHVVAERERSSSDKPANAPAPQTDQSQRLSEAEPCGRRLNATLSHCDVESLWSDCSMRSGSTFDTRDEAAFRDGLAALDASIASLQKTMKLDLRR